MEAAATFRCLSPMHFNLNSKILHFEAKSVSTFLSTPKHSMLSITNDKRMSTGKRLSVSRPVEKDIVGKACSPARVVTYPGGATESHSQMAEEKIGVVLLNLGGPETLQDVQPFLFNLFADSDIVHLPRLFKFLQRQLALLISVLGAPRSKERYAAIKGGSPRHNITYDQAHAIALALKAKEVPAIIYVAMRYWHPYTEQAVHQVKIDRITRLVVLPLYPQYSISTTRASIRVLQDMFRNDSYLSRLPVAIVHSWYQRKGYIKSMADLIEKELQTFPTPEETMIFFTAHGIPVSYVEKAGDPYKYQMKDCIFLIMQELKSRGTLNDHTLAYESRAGPVQWLKPYTDEVVVQLGQRGIKSLLAVPVSFVSECIETLEGTDIELKELALKSGIVNWGRVPALNCTSTFIDDMADAVLEALPLAMPVSFSVVTSKDAGNNLLGYCRKLLFGSILAFSLLQSPRIKNSIIMALSFLFSKAKSAFKTYLTEKIDILIWIGFIFLMRKAIFAFKDHLMSQIK